VAAIEEEQEVLHASVRSASVAQMVIAIIAVLGLFYLAKPVLVTICTSLLIAFILEPLVALLMRIQTLVGERTVITQTPLPVVLERRAS